MAIPHSVTFKCSHILPSTWIGALGVTLGYVATAWPLSSHERHAIANRIDRGEPQQRFAALPQGDQRHILDTLRHTLDETYLGSVIRQFDDVTTRIQQDFSLQDGYDTTFTRTPFMNPLSFPRTLMRNICMESLMQ